MRNEDRSLDLSRAEQDEPVGVGNVYGTTGSLPIISRVEFLYVPVKRAAYQVTLCL